MRISPITPYYPSKTPSFRASDTAKIRKESLPFVPEQRSLFVTMNPEIVPDSLSELEEGQFLDFNGRIYNKHVTTYCRNDLNWYDLGKFLKEKFESPKDVNFHVFGCSAGDEPYTLALLLTRIYDTTDFEIDASDIAGYMIEQNIREQKFGALIEPFEYFRVCRDLNLIPDGKDKYFIKTLSSYPKIRTDIANTVKFRKANILKEIDNIDTSKPSVIFCRNMWPYVDSSKYKDFTQKLYDKLPVGSLVVIGDFDYAGDYNYKGSDGFPKALQEAGFKPTDRGGSNLKKLDNKDYCPIYEK